VYPAAIRLFDVPLHLIPLSIAGPGAETALTPTSSGQDVLHDVLFGVFMPLGAMALRGLLFPPVSTFAIFDMRYWFKVI
jgi:hypothetical protein